MREDAAVHALPVAPYLKLTLPEARSRAAVEGRELRVLDESRSRRPTFRFRRVNVLLGSDGRVEHAHVDGGGAVDSFPPRPGTA